jgi:microcystin-dependent protein
MPQPYIGEIRIFAGNFAPSGWLFCEGQLLPISENEALYQLIDTKYGGDGQSSFALPDLRGRIPLHFGTGPDGIVYPQAQQAGVEEVTLTVQQIPSHSHPMLVSGSGHVLNPAANTNIATAFSPTVQGLQAFTPGPATTQLKNDNIVPSGGSQPHTNFMPYLVVNFIISLFGIFPSQT